MVIKDKVKGLLYGIGSLILIGIQPIIANSRPSEIDAYLFAMMTVIYQALIFLPLLILERKSLHNIIENSENIIIIKQLKGWRKHKKLIIYLGINFAIAQVLFYVAYRLAGAINASLAQKTTVIFGLLFGFLINHEKISVSQIFFSVLLLFGVILAVTNGSFNLLEFNIGIVIMMVTTILWMLAHALTKPILETKEISSIQLVFMRNFLNGLVLIMTYFLFYPLENIKLIVNPVNQFFFILMGFVYGFDLFCWYLSLKYIDISTASIIIAPSPIITAIIATIFLGDNFTFFHVFGTVIIIISIIFIVKKKSQT
ncbi:MAG: DMT family transporter [Candidatus Lokiarchaeota archaeon]|nr:DMT family transporter [Candidatus Lokiarchaeota archaeon]